MNLLSNLNVVAGMAVLFSGLFAAENPLVFVSGYDSTITCLEFNPADGSTKVLSQSDGGKNPTYLAIDPSHKFLVAANETNPGKVSSYSIDSKDGKLTRINEGSSGGGGPCHIVVHPTGKWVFTGNYGSGHIGVLPLKPDGSVGEPVAIKGGKNAHEVVLDPTGKFVFTPFLGSDYVAQYKFDDATGALTPNDPPHSPTAAKAGPRHMAFDPSGTHAYVINELNSTMDSLDYDKAKGVLSAPQTLPTIPEPNPKNSTAHVVVSPDGKFVYGSNRGHDSIVIFAVGPDGRLKLVGHETGGGEIKTPRDFSLDLTGKYLLVASQGADYVTVFARDAETGLLKKIGKQQVAPKPSFVGFMAR